MKGNNCNEEKEKGRKVDAAPIVYIPEAIERKKTHFFLTPCNNKKIEIPLSSKKRGKTQAEGERKREACEKKKVALTLQTRPKITSYSPSQQKNGKKKKPQQPRISPVRSRKKEVTHQQSEKTTLHGEEKKKGGGHKPALNALTGGLGCAGRERKRGIWLRALLRTGCESEKKKGDLSNFRQKYFHGRGGS